ncbi:glycosyltransferase family 2 protein [Embleya scabrispora]|uniref:glycosyltransferase family 2 protein n=1 Tax=Embleya scabrispora TaxID=159449 RepID=UPI00037BB814|nr:glycosyltransferase family A protein [Embleya scabrispora]MYS84470.1 glycosyltransferase [Streptomyces sp. SID5474]
MAATVSVIVPTRDRTALLADALRSVVLQGMRDIEVVVVNDGGADVAGVLPLGVRGMTVRLLSFPRSRGPAAARNAGLEIATGRFVAFLDDDDMYLPGHLDRALAALESTGSDAIYADCILSGDRAMPGETPAGPYHYDFPYDPDMLSVANFVPTTAVVARNPAHTAPASWFRFDPELPLLVDWSLWLRLVHDRGWSFARLSEPGVVYHREAADSSLSGGAAAQLDSLDRYEDTYRTIVARWPVPPTGRVARFRRHALTMFAIAREQLSTGAHLAPFAYEDALRVLHAGFTGRLEEEDVPTRLSAVLTGAAAPTIDACGPLVERVQQ